MPDAPRQSLTLLDLIGALVVVGTVTASFSTVFAAPSIARPGWR